MFKNQNIKNYYKNTFKNIENKQNNNHKQTARKQLQTTTKQQQTTNRCKTCKSNSKAQELQNYNKR